MAILIECGELAADEIAAALAEANCSFRRSTQRNILSDGEIIVGIFVPTTLTAIATLVQFVLTPKTPPTQIFNIHVDGQAISKDPESLKKLIDAIKDNNQS